MKELDALERLAMPDELHIEECKRLGIGLTEDYEVIAQALNRLEAIDNAEPSEALKCLELIGGTYLLWGKETVAEGFKEEFNTIKQALIKAEKEHRAFEIIKKNFNLLNEVLE